MTKGSNHQTSQGSLVLCRIALHPNGSLLILVKPVLEPAYLRIVVGQGNHWLTSRQPGILPCHKLLSRDGYSRINFGVGYTCAQRSVEILLQGCRVHSRRVPGKANTVNGDQAAQGMFIIPQFTALSVFPTFICSFRRSSSQGPSTRLAVSVQPFEVLATAPAS